jgi:hypothetical protein
MTEVMAGRGFGYGSVGYLGGYWRGSGFCYKRTVDNITNVSITNCTHATSYKP